MQDKKPASYEYSVSIFNANQDGEEIINGLLTMEQAKSIAETWLDCMINKEWSYLVIDKTPYDSNDEIMDGAEEVYRITKEQWLECRKEKVWIRNQKTTAQQ